MALYNTTMAGEGFYDLVMVGNNASNGILVGGLIIVLFFVLLVKTYTKTDKFAVSFALASFISFIVSALFTFIELMGWIYPLAFLALTAFSLLISYVQRG